jgi:multidrug efflux pump subunit AcrA (membrane-fusion protein)
MKELVTEREKAAGTIHAGNGFSGEHRSPVGGPPASWMLRIGALLALVAAGGWAYYTNVHAAKPAMDMTMRVSAGSAAFPVVTAAVEHAPISGVVTYTGSVAAFSEQDIFPRVTGRILEMPVYPGDAVQVGQVVARLDDVELTSRLGEAEATAATALASRAQVEADAVAASHVVVQMERELTMVEAELTYASGVRGRSERLMASELISRQEYENTGSMARALEAKREAAQAKLDQARAMEASAGKKLEAAASMVTQGQAAVRTARIVRDYVTIAAPTSGYVVKRLVAPGALVQPGTAILRIAQVDRVRLQANVGEKDVALIRLGAPVTVSTTGGSTLTARVTSVVPFVEPGPRTAVVEAIVDNRDRRMLTGQYVTMAFVTSQRPDAITVPRGAVARLGGTAKVWVVSDGRAEPREVTTGLESGERLEILRGLAGSERVVARGHENLYAGARVSEVSGVTRPGGTGSPGPTSNGPAAPGEATTTSDGPHAHDSAPKAGGHAGH